MRLYFSLQELRISHKIFFLFCLFYLLAALSHFAIIRNAEQGELLQNARVVGQLLSSETWWSMEPGKVFRQPAAMDSPSQSSQNYYYLPIESVRSQDVGDFPGATLLEHLDLQRGGEYYEFHNHSFHYITSLHVPSQAVLTFPEDNRVYTAGEIHGVLYVALPQKPPLKTIISNLSATHIALTFGAALLFYLFARFIILNPIYNLFQAANRITHTKDFSTRIPCRSRRGREGQLPQDEITALGQSFNRMIDEINISYRKLERSQLNIIEILGYVAEFRDKETGNHIRRVSEYATTLARHAGLSDEECTLIRHASPMHDIGKVGISDEILNKKGKLNHEEFELVKQHTTLGGNILRAQEGTEEIILVARIIALEHHEWWNGHGYPHGKKGEEISFYGRIVAIADVFDALTSRRPYKDEWDIAESVNYIREMKGIQFDPDLVDLLLENLSDMLEIKRIYSDTAPETGTGR